MHFWLILLDSFEALFCEMLGVTLIIFDPLIFKIHDMHDKITEILSVNSLHFLYIIFFSFSQATSLGGSNFTIVNR